MSRLTVESIQHAFHKHSASISRVPMTTVHSVMTTEEPLMACWTPWLPVGFLLWLSLSPWIQNHPLSSLFFRAGSRPQFFSCLAESAHTQTHIGWNSNTKTHGYTYRLQKQSLHIYICIYARIQRYSRAVEKVFKHTNIGETAPRAHPNLSIQESLCARKHVWLMGWLAGGG